MSKDKTFESRMEAELSCLRANEVEKRMLHDRTIGGSNVPRPSQEFIERHTGPLHSEQELQQHARQTIERQQREEKVAEKRQSQFSRSLREHNRHIKMRAKSSQDRGQDR